jgi:hypothetical protein
MIAASTYSFALAFGTKFRVISIALIANGFLMGGMYGSVNIKDAATFKSLPSIVIVILVTMALLEWAWRHFYENEVCWFYTIFQRRSKE